MLAYTLNRLFTQQAVLQRDTSAPDAFGADTPPNWQPLGVVPCRLWWVKSSGARPANRVYVDPAREVALSVGGLIFPTGTDVTERDRITMIQDRQGNLLIDGIFQITTTLDQGTHMEVDVLRTHLGG